MLAIIGGSGLATLANLKNPRRKSARTPYGSPSARLTFGRIGRRDVVFLARHGDGHTIAPHEVNYRANLWSLKKAGAREVVSVATVGGITASMVPGAMVIPHQIIDYTWGRRSTYFEGKGKPVQHIDFTEPYSRALRARLLAAAKDAGESIADKGVYAATQGPRLETAAEIDRLGNNGVDLVGMTGMPEAALAREINLEYAAIAVVVNYAAGRGESQRAIPTEKIPAVVDKSMARVRRIIEELCK